ncbi:MAG: hypothetical protein KDE35_17195 [Geminicoccaceae bacterium]|nr:hypothetical protein [Geminicoccaceae bacterium]
MGGGMDKVIFAVIMALIALVGLAMAARAADATFALFGWLIMGFGVIAVAIVVHRATDYSGRRP